ncbi:MAG: thioredoxin domain-containing protein [Campylobacterota bacterium]|nr:thioredoxin domain-containing protein [Campylobacterota bacterium]
MRLSMLKLLMIASLLSSSLIASKTIDDKILKYEKNRIGSILKRQGINLEKVTILLKQDLKQDGWHGYVFNLHFKIKGIERTERDSLFTNGSMITPDLISFKTKRSFKDVLYPKLSDKYFSKEHLIAGNPNAKHSLVIFSDPLCPICVDEVPFIIKKVLDNPKNIALYYYHLPLDMHPTAKTLSKASIIARKLGIKNVDYRIYNENFPDKYKFDAYKEKNHQKVLNFFNKEFGTNITMKQIADIELENKIKYDIKMSEDALVKGTPTIFFDGIVDIRRDKYEKYLK